MKPADRYASDATVTQILHALRAMRWSFIVIGAALGSVLVLISHVVDVGPFASAHAGIGLAVLAIAVGAAFVLDDPAASTFEALPATLRWRASVRIAMATVLVAVAFGTVLVVAWERLAYADVVGQATALVVLAVAGAAVAGRVLGWDRPGIVGAAVVIGLLLADGLSLLPGDDALLTGGALRAAPAAITDLTWVLLVTVAAAGYVWGTRDPGGRARR